MGQWLPFLDELWGRGFLAVKADMPKPNKNPIWVGVSLTPGPATVRWSEPDVQRIAALLTLWWYFHTSKSSKVGSFMTRLKSPKANEKFTRSKRTDREPA